MKCFQARRKQPGVGYGGIAAENLLKLGSSESQVVGWIILPVSAYTSYFRVPRSTSRIIHIDIGPDALDESAYPLADICAAMACSCQRTQRLSGDDIVCHTPLILFALGSSRQKSQHIAVHAPQIRAMLLGVFQPLPDISVILFSLMDRIVDLVKPTK